jgi:hypothetical protein
MLVVVTVLDVVVAGADGALPAGARSSVHCGRLAQDGVGGEAVLMVWLLAVGRKVARG